MTEAGSTRVAFVVATLGKSPVLQQALAAIDRQRDDLPLRLVVVTQGAMDITTRQTVQQFADHHIEENHPLGFSAANNIAIRTVLENESPPEFVALVNDDAILGDGWLALLIDTLEAQPEAASAQGLNLQPVSDRDSQLVDGTGIAWNARKQAIQVGHGELACTGSQETRVQSRFGVSATAAVYRAAALQSTVHENAVFDETLDTYYEDVDLACRLRNAGWKALWVPSATCVHAGSSSAPLSRPRLLVANRHLVLARYLGRSYLLKAPLLALRDVADFGWHAPAGWARTLRWLPSYLNWSTALPLSDRTQL